jgi:glycosyltransferase involved in cell wall biosynthesis
VEAVRRRLGLPGAAPLALYAGDVRKGLSAALGGLAAAPAWHLAVATRSPSSARDRLGPHADVEGRLHWLGAVDDMTSLYQAADVLLHPTICDSFGLVVSEAMACGTPAAVTRHAGIHELLEHGQSGWIMNEASPEAVATALGALADASLRRRLGDGARAVAARRTWDDVARDTLAVYERTARP